MPRWVEEERPDNEESTDESEFDDEDIVEDEEPAPQRQLDDIVKDKEPQRQRIKVALNKATGDLSCHVCGQRGHQAGFVGSVYLDCINKPCYLCKQPGHTTATCPHRTAPETGCTSAANSKADALLPSILNRCCTPCSTINTAVSVPEYAVDAAILKLLSRRCTCLEFHPNRDNLVLCGDKKGHVAVWDFAKVSERTVYTTFHTCLVNTLKFLPGADGMKCMSASSDGMCKLFDMETGGVDTVCNLNPGGWIEGVTKDKDWGMWYGMDVIGGTVVAAGDTFGRLHLLDTRVPTPQAVAQIQKRGTKVAHVHANPADPNLLLTSGGDHIVRLLDLRQLPSGEPLPVGKGAVKPSAAEMAAFNHRRAVNAAYFSPLTGTRILTTCQDNRLRVWDNTHCFGAAPDREIVHSHDFNRHLTPFKAEFDPKDHRERLVVVGRYISEPIGGVALHPVDIMDVATGRLLAELVDANLTTISPVNKPHPRLDVIVSGSSRSIYAWRPARDAEDVEALDRPRRGSRFVAFDVDDEKKKAARKSTSEEPSSLKKKQKKGDDKPSGGRRSPP